MRSHDALACLFSDCIISHMALQIESCEHVDHMWSGGVTCGSCDQVGSHVDHVIRWGHMWLCGSHVIIVWGHMYLDAGSCDCMVSQVLRVIKSSIQSHNSCIWLCVITCQAVQSLGSYIESHHVGSCVTCTLACDHVRSHVKTSLVPRKDTRPSPAYTYCKQLKAGWGLGTCEIMWDHMWSCEITWLCLWAMEPYAECLLFILGEKKLFLRCCY